MDFLLVEDDPVLADGLRHALLESGYAVTQVASGRRADQLLIEQKFDLVILDLGLPDMDGAESVVALASAGK